MLIKEEFKRRLTRMPKLEYFGCNSFITKLNLYRDIRFFLN